MQMTQDAEETIAKLSSSGYRVTQPRRAVVEVLVRAKRSLSPEEICDRARKIHAEVGLATVYRTLDMLQEMGLLSRVQIGSKGYALSCAEHKLHLHLVCRKCHGVTEVEADGPLAQLQHQLDDNGFASQGGAIEMLGLCQRCR